MRICVGVGGISPKFKNSEDGTLVSSTSHHHPPPLIKVQGQCPPPSYNIHVPVTVHKVYYVLENWTGMLYVLG